MGPKGNACLLRALQEQQETIERQGRLIADLASTLEQWEEMAGYDGAALKLKVEETQGKGAQRKTGGREGWI